MPVNRYNTTASVYVKLVPIKSDGSLACSGGNIGGRCQGTVVYRAELGQHSQLACSDDGCIDCAELMVAQAFVDEMMDQHGNVPERKID
jgi:hypothetical protein